MKNTFLMLFLLFLLELFPAGESLVSGKVSNLEGEALSDVSVVIKETAEGIVAGIDGRYQMTVPEGDFQLVFSCPGYKDRTIPIGEQEIIDVVLIPAQSAESVMISEKDEITENAFSAFCLL